MDGSGDRFQHGNRPEESAEKADRLESGQPKVITHEIHSEEQRRGSPCPDCLNRSRQRPRSLYDSHRTRQWAAMITHADAELGPSKPLGNRRRQAVSSCQLCRASRLPVKAAEPEHDAVVKNLQRIPTSGFSSLCR